MVNKELEKNYVPFQCMIINHVNRYRVEGIPTAQYYILEILLGQGSKTTNELAALRGISQSGISKITKVLLEKGYIVQERNPSDRRYYNLVITEQGKEFLARSEQFRNEILHRIEDALTKDEITLFSNLCNKIVAGRS